MTVTRNDNCSGLQLKVGYPGEDDLATTPQHGQYDDFLKSYICY